MLSQTVTMVEVTSCTSIRLSCTASSVPALAAAVYRADAYLPGIPCTVIGGCKMHMYALGCFSEDLVGNGKNISFDLQKCPSLGNSRQQTLWPAT